MQCSRISLQKENHNAETQFREGRSTHQTIDGVRTLIQATLDQTQELVLIFVDLRKAFDSIRQAAIIDGMIEIGSS